jgi:hypothetical protein
MLLRLILLAASSAVALPVQADWLESAAQNRLKQFDGTNIEKRTDIKKDRRGKVTMRRINPQCKSDWDNDATALPYFFYQLKVRTDDRYPCYVDNRGIRLTGDEIYDYPLIYFTSHYGFTFSDEEVENLKKYLARGGTLLLDDCTGSGPFTDSFPANVQRIAPGTDIKRMLRDTKEFFDLFNICYEVKRMPKLKEQFMQPFQAAYVNGRPAILFCPNDYGCGWEVSSPPTALNPLGNPAHGDPTPTAQQGREEVYQLSINWFFYALTH